MALTITWNATNFRFELSGWEFTGTSIGTGNTTKRIYFNASTFTADEYNNRIFYINSGTASSDRVWYKILDTGTDYLDVYGEFIEIPDATSAIRIIGNMESIYSSAANTGQITKDESTYSSKTAYKIVDAALYVLDNTFWSINSNITSIVTASYPVGTQYLLTLGNNAGWIIGFGDSRSGFEKSYNDKLCIEALIKGWSGTIYPIFSYINTNFYCKIRTFNCTLKTDADVYVNRRISISVLNDDRFIDTTIVSYNLVSASNNQFSGGYFYNCTFENCIFRFGSLDYFPEIKGLSLINKNETFRSSNFGAIVHFIPNKDITVSNLKLLDSPTVDPLLIASMNSTADVNAILRINNIAVPKTSYFDVSNIGLGLDGQKVYINSLFNLKVVDDNNLPINNANVDLECLDDASLNITGLTTDINGEISEQTLRAYYYERVTGTVQRTDTINWKITISATDKCNFSKKYVLNAILDNLGFINTAINEVASLTALDTTPPTWVTTTGIQDVLDNENGTVKISYGTATDTESEPVSYNIYVKKDTATGLFDVANKVTSTFSTVIDIGEIIAPVDWDVNSTYYFGVRAMDRLGNEETNTVNQSLTGVTPGLSVLNAEVQKISKQTALIPALV